MSQELLWTDDSKKREPPFLTPSASFYPKNLIHALPYKPSSTARISDGALFIPTSRQKTTF